jgi:hypothetical protein
VFNKNVEKRPKKSILKPLEHKILWFDWKKSCKPLNLKRLAADNRQYVIMRHFSLNPSKIKNEGVRNFELHKISHTLQSGRGGDLPFRCARQTGLENRPRFISLFDSSDMSRTATENLGCLYSTVRP